MSTLAGIRFYHEGDTGGHGLRCWKGSRSVGEFYWKKHWELPSLYFHFGDSEGVDETLDLVFKFLWFSAYVPLFKTGRQPRNRWDDKSRNYGWYWMDRRSLWIWWGERHFSWDLPFLTKIFVKHEILSLRREVVHDCKDDFNGGWVKRQSIIADRSIKLPYRYECLNGEIQNVTAIVHLERWTRRIKWTPFNRQEDCIAVEFSEEVGPEKGSWKGGCVGCGYTMLPTENAITCLRRMERERRFEK